MDSKTQIEAMARKYKEEMLRMYKQSGKSSGGASQTASPQKKAEPMPQKPAQAAQPMKPTADERVMPPNNGSVQEGAHTEKAVQTPPKPQPAPKFLSPEEIMREEYEETLERRVPPQADAREELSEPSEAVSPRERAADEPENFQGNYNSEEFSDMSDPLEPRYSGGENASPDESGIGYIKAEVTTGSGAVPIENAVVLITKKDNGRTYLLKMLISDESGSTETAALPAPNVSFSETPDPSEKPFADYFISAYADGFYAENDMEVPVFSGVKSIQPIALIPKASDDSRFMLN